MRAVTWQPAPADCWGVVRGRLAGADDLNTVLAATWGVLREKLAGAEDLYTVQAAQPARSDCPAMAPVEDWTCAAIMIRSGGTCEGPGTASYTHPDSSAWARSRVARDQ